MIEKTPQVLLAGCGDLGITLGEQLLEQGFAVTGLRRNADKLPASFNRISIDLTQPEQLQQLAGTSFDVVVMTFTPTEYSEAGYRQAYVKTTENVLGAITLAPNALILFASSTGVYHQSDSSWVDETSPTEPARYSGQLMLQAEELVKTVNTTAVNVRFGGIYGGGRNRFIDKVKEGACWPEQSHYTNRIHRRDCVGVLKYLIQCHQEGRDLDNCYVAVDDQPSTLAEVMHWMREQLNIAGGDSENVLRRSGSKRCSNRRLRQLGYEFIYPSYREGYGAVMANLV